jgi:hypothetical protein
MYLAVLAGCGFQPAPVGFASDGATIDTPDGPPDDVDSDGVPNAMDNCPNVANPGQDNEDGDDRGDACDLCPHMAGTVPGTDADDDGDGIGNQCDPRPALKDRRVVFLGFNDPAELGHFENRNGSFTWSISNGKLHQNDTSINPQNIVWTGENLQTDVFVQTHAHVDSFTSATGTRIAAVVGAWDDTGAIDAYACGLRANDKNQPLTSTGWHFVTPPNFDQQTNAPTSGTFTVGIDSAETLLAQTAPNGNDSTLDCFEVATPAHVDVPTYIPRGYPGLRTFNVTASFDYLFVVAIGMP